MKSHYEKAVRKYLMLCTVLGCALVLIWLVSCIWIRGFVAIFLLLIILIVSKIAISIIAKKTLLTVLFDELDAVEFQKIVNDNRFKVPLVYCTSAAVSSGDYQTVVNIATKSISNKKASIKVKYYYLSALARVYFELRDFEKLRLLVAKYDEYKACYSSKGFLNSSNSLWSYYRYFLEQEYEACKIVCKERNLGIIPNSWDAKLLKLKNDFFYAVACYENQEFDEAEKTFKSIISYAPKMYISNISEKYLVAIEQNLQFPFTTSNIIPESDFQIYDSKILTKLRRNRLIKIICAVAIAILLIVSSLFGGLGKNKSSDIIVYEKKLNLALQEKYDEYDIISFFNLCQDDEITDVFCIVKDEKDQYNIGFIVTYDGAETFDYISAVNDIERGSAYVVKSPTGMHSISIDVGLKSGIDYDKKVDIRFDGSKVAIGFVYV